MSSRKIYIVESSWGSYDDAYTKVEKAFHRQEDAQEFKEKFEAFENQPAGEEPIPVDEDNMTEEEWREWDKWVDKTYNTFNTCLIKEVELI